MMGNGRLNCEQSSVTLYQINDTYNSDKWEICQLLRKAELHEMEHFNIKNLGGSENENYSKLPSTKSSLQLTRSAVRV